MGYEIYALPPSNNSVLWVSYVQGTFYQPFNFRRVLTLWPLEASAVWRPRRWTLHVGSQLVCCHCPSSKHARK